jgi:putative nucleotidyltransferase with HDIG domain
MAAAAWQAISELFKQVGESDYVGEPVSQKEHSLQAARFASDATKSQVGFFERNEVSSSLLSAPHLPLSSPPKNLTHLDLRCHPFLALLTFLLSAPYAPSPTHTQVVLAALLHDIGHMLALQRPGTERMGDCGAMHHEVIGGDHLRALNFSPRVAKLVQEHVNAKRYLVAVKPEYAAKLSAASTTTLGYQGGPFTPEECAAFERDPDKDTILKMRTWDEAAKVPGMVVPALDTYKEMIMENVQATVG